MEWREGECSLRIWRDYCAWGTFLAADLPFEASERWESLLNLFPIVTRLHCQKTTALAAKSPATQAKESVSLSLRSMAVLSSRAHERPSREIRARSAREREAKPNQNRHATQAMWVPVPFFVAIPSISSLHESPLYEFGTPRMVIILEYEQSLFFLNSPSSKTRETSKWTWA